MLNMLRESISGPLAKIFIGLLVLSFAVWGIQDIFGNYGQRTIAKIDKITLTVENYIDEYNNKPSWVVHFSKSSKNHHTTIKYLGRYLKRPPIGETRIIEYDWKDVTFAYLDHHTKTQHQVTLPVFDFIKRLISHVPDRYFRIVRYYN